MASPASGWAQAPGVAHGHTPGDPWEGVNRKIYSLNEVLDRLIIKPLSRFTSGLTPGPIGKVIHNFLVNLNEPVVIVNDLLQARPGPAFRSGFRLVINTTVGGLGAVDVAKAMGDPMHVNGFGDTLGRWGVSPGPYIIIPVFGPSSVRDLVGMIVDDATLPVQSVSYPYRTEVDITLVVVGGLNERADVDHDLDELLGGAADPYATLRSSYLQSREARVRGQAVLPPLPDIEQESSPPAVAEPSAGSQVTVIVAPTAESSEAPPPTVSPLAPSTSGDAVAETPAPAADPPPTPPAGPPTF